MKAKMNPKAHRSAKSHSELHERDLRDKLSAKEEENAVLLEMLQRVELEKVVCTLKALTHKVRHLRKELDDVSERELRLKAMINEKEQKLEKMYTNIQRADGVELDVGRGATETQHAIDHPHSPRDCERLADLQAQKVDLLSTQNTLKARVAQHKKEMISQRQRIVMEEPERKRDTEQESSGNSNSRGSYSPARELRNEIQRIKTRNTTRQTRGSRRQRAYQPRNLSPDWRNVQRRPSPPIDVTSDLIDIETSRKLKRLLRRERNPLDRITAAL